MGVEFKCKILSNYSRGVKWQQGVTIGIGFCLYNVFGWPLWMCCSGVVVDTAKHQSSSPGLFHGRGRYDLLFSVEMVNLLWKKKGWGGGWTDRTLHFVILMVWSALVVGGWVAAWGKTSYLELAKIWYTVYLIWFKDRGGGCRVSCVYCFRQIMECGGSITSAFMECCLNAGHMCLACLPSKWVNPYVLYPSPPWWGQWWLLRHFSTNGAYSLSPMVSWCCFRELT